MMWSSGPWAAGLRVAAVVLLAFAMIAGCDESDDGDEQEVTAPEYTFVYVVNSLSNDISAFAIESGTEDVVTLGSGSIGTDAQPDVVALAPDADHLFVAANVSQTLTSYEIDRNSGALSVVNFVTTGTSPVDIAVDPDGEFLLVSLDSDSEVESKGLTGGGQLSSVNSYGIGGLLSAVAIHPNGGKAYSAISTGNLVVPLTINPDLSLTADASQGTGSQPWSLAVTPDGSYLYSLNRGSSITIFETDGGGAPSEIVGGGSPYNLGGLAWRIQMSPSGETVYVLDNADGLSAFAIDPSSGELSNVSGSPYDYVAEGGLGISADGSVLAVVDYNTDELYLYQVSASTGALTKFPDAPYATGVAPTDVVIVTPGD